MVAACKLQEFWPLSGKRNRHAPCTPPQLRVVTLSGILASVRINKQACPMHSTSVACSYSVRNFGLCQEKGTGMPHALHLSCV